MKKFLVLYRSDEDAAARMAASTPEEQQAGMQLWTEWFGRAGSAIVDGGAPLTGGNGTVSGYSILQAESSEASLMFSTAIPTRHTAAERSRPTSSYPSPECRRWSAIRIRVHAAKGLTALVASSERVTGRDA